MSGEEVVSGLLILGGLLYVLFAGWLRARRGFEGWAAGALIWYALFAGAWEWVQAAGRLGLLTPSISEPLARILLVALALILVFLNRSFLRRAGMGLAWWIVGAVGAGAVALIGFNLVNLAPTLPLTSGWSISRSELAHVIAVFAWAILVGGATWMTRQAYHETRQPLHRNRIKYWSLALTLTVLGDGLRFVGQEAVGSALRLFAAGLIAYVLITHDLPDVRQVARQSLSYLLVTLLTTAVLIGGYLGAAFVLRRLTGSALWAAGLALAVLLAILFRPALDLMRRIVGRAVAGTTYDPGDIVREYSLAISNILDLERLATTVVGLMRRALGSERGVLFLVDESKREELGAVVRLRAVSPAGADGGAPAAGLLHNEHALARCLRQEHRPLTQYDIDLLADFKDAAPDERSWLAGLAMDVYMPIHAKGEWIGLLALGPKGTRDRYFDDDLVLLNTLADQTAVALKNARLVEDLRHLNADLKDAYASLERANHQLQELDKLKTSFIGVVTHELRTPFVNLEMSVQLLERYGTEAWAAEQREQLAQLSNGLKSGRQMVDNLIAFSTFLSKQGDLHLSRVSFNEVVTSAVEGLRFMAEKKSLGLEMNVPSDLPPLDGDRDRLGEAVHHLVHNAIKFTEHGKVSVSCWATDTAVTFEVKDTGVSIPPDRLPDLWKSFEQMADPLKRGQEGLGLGLALVKFVVTAHGGEVWAHSTQGVGSTFGFYIPLKLSRQPVEGAVARVK
jgi:signal transduction histidine kinase